MGRETQGPLSFLGSRAEVGRGRERPRLGCDLRSWGQVRVLGAVFTDWTDSSLSPPCSMLGFRATEVFQLCSENENTAQEASTSSCLCQFTSGSGCTAGPRSSQDQLHVLPSPSVHWSREPCTQGKGLSSTDCQSPLCPSAPKMVRKEPIFFTEEPGTEDS